MVFLVKPFFKRVVITQTTLLLEFSVKPFFKRVVITPIGFGDKFIKFKRCWSFRSSLFSKGCDHADHVVAGVFGQAFFQKGCF